MKIRKLLAVGAVALGAGALMTGGILAQSTSLGDFVATDDGSLTSPMIVVGDSVPGSDVIGAADIAAAVAGYATTPTVISGQGATVTVTGGVSLSTPNQNLFLNNSINRAKGTLTSTDLPTLLASGTTELGSTEHEYDLFIDVGDSLIQFGNSNENIDPLYHIEAGTAVGSPLYTAKVVFNKPYQFNSTSAVGETIELFGTDYTIASTTIWNKVILNGAGSTLTLEEGESATVEIGSSEYEITLRAVESTDDIFIRVTGPGEDESDEVTEGSTETVGGLDIFAKTVVYSSRESAVNFAVLQVGSAQLTLEHDSRAKKEIAGEDEFIDNTNVTITGTAPEVSSIEIAVAATVNDDDHVSEDLPFLDPVFSSFSVVFGGMTPASGAADIEEIETGVSGDDDATVTFTDHRGQTNSLNVAHLDGSNNRAVQDSGGDTIYYYEGANMTEDQYFYVDAGEFGHLFEITSIDPPAGDEGEVSIQDVISGTEITKTLPEDSYNVDWIIDGQTYKLRIHDDTADKIEVTWGTGATYGDVGDAVTVYPIIKTTKGGWLGVADDINVSATTVAGWTNATDIELPGDPKCTFALTAGAGQAIDVENSLLTSANMSTGCVAQLSYNVTINTTALTNFALIRMNNPDTASGDDEPVVFVLEEEDDDNHQNAIILPVDYDSSNTELEWSTPQFTNSVYFSAQQETDDDVTEGVDEWGTMYSYDTQPDQPTVDVYYPDYQTFASVAIGEDPEFSLGGGGAVVQEALRITNPIAKFANEINTASLNSDLILVGGPCANSLVATLMAADNITCSNWAYTTGVIREYSDAFSSGQKALVVAGTVASDTRNLAAQVMSGTLSFEQ